MKHLPDLFIQYPQLQTLRALVSDDIIDQEIGARVDEFVEYLKEAKTRIPTTNLNRVFPEELEHGSIQLENFLGHWGNVSIEELCKICLIVQWLRPQKILELGTYNGMTTLQMALNAPPSCKIFTLDLPPQKAAQIDLGVIDRLIANQFKERFNTATGNYFSQRSDLGIQQLWGDTSTFDYSIVGSNVDLIFIDAAHDYKHKKHDTETAFRLLSPSGVILWHDYAQVANPDVTRCVSEFAEKKSIFHLRNTNLAVHYAGHVKR